ncbi:MAG: DegQ family serine endoprotease [Planctomycetota bacterium]|jgi:serine protease Do
MNALNLRQKKAFPRWVLTSILIFFIVCTVPISAFAQDSKSIGVLRQMGKAFAEIAEKASPAVVSITTEKKVTHDYPSMREWPFGDSFGDDFFDYFFKRRYPQRPSPRPEPPKFRQMAQGSGFIVSRDGYILTNNHVVAGVDKINVKLADERSFEAKLIGTDPDSEVAVIKIDAAGLQFLELADSDKVEVGEWVLAIGNPFGLSHTVTAGIVSAKGRSGFGLADYENFIQTDAAINRGNSGGPLLNLDGRVIGINTAIFGATGNVGIGLAIPINMAKSVYSQLISGGKVVRGFLGVGIQDLTPDLAESLEIKNTKGIVITDVTEDSAAGKIGLKQYDIIVEFNGEKVEKTNDFRNRVAMLKPGTEVKLVVLRDGTRKNFTVELGQRPEPGRLAGTPSEAMEGLGFSVQNLTDELAERFGYEGRSGVIVNQVQSGSIAELAGIAPGVLIMEVNRQPVKNVKQFSKALKNAKKARSVLLLIDNGRYNVLLTLPLSK